MSWYSRLLKHRHRKPLQHKNGLAISRSGQRIRNRLGISKSGQLLGNRNRPSVGRVVNGSGTGWASVVTLRKGRVCGA